MKVPYCSPKIGGVRVCAGPLFEYIGVFLGQEKALGYKSESTATQTHLQLISRLNLWLARMRSPLKDLNEDVVERFLKQPRRNRNYHRAGAPTALRRLLQLLREVGAIPPVARPAPGNPAERIVDEYRCFLAKERGLNPVTIGHYARHIDRFLSERFRTGRLRLSQLDVRDGAAFVQRKAHGHSRGHALSVVTALRSFLRFARYRGYIETDLGSAMPRVANWKLAGLPKYLPRAAAQQVLAHCDKTTATGRRNYAILMLLARLGLRGGEVVDVRLEDVPQIPPHSPARLDPQATAELCKTPRSVFCRTGAWILRRFLCHVQRKAMPQRQCRPRLPEAVGADRAARTGGQPRPADPRSAPPIRHHDPVALVSQRQAGRPAIAGAGHLSWPQPWERDLLVLELHARADGRRGKTTGSKMERSPPCRRALIFPP